MFWPPETWGSNWEVRDIVFSLEANSCKVDDDDLIAHPFGLPAKDIIYFDISVRYVIIMHVLHSLTSLQENYPGNVTQASSVVL